MRSNFQFKYHVLVCVSQRPAAIETRCAADGEEARAVYMKLTRAVNDNQMWGQVMVSSTSCLGVCGRGTTIVVYPENTWYLGVDVEDVDEIIQGHLLDGRPVERLLERVPLQRPCR